MDSNDFDLFENIELTSKQRKELEEHDKVSDIIIKMIGRRFDLGMTQRELAKRSGIKQPMIARIETFDVIPRMDTIIKLCSALGLELGIVNLDKLENKKLEGNLTLSKAYKK